MGVRVILIFIFFSVIFNGSHGAWAGYGEDSDGSKVSMTAEPLSADSPEAPPSVPADEEDSRQQYEPANPAPVSSPGPAGQDKWEAILQKEDQILRELAAIREELNIVKIRVSQST